MSRELVLGGQSRSTDLDQFPVGFHKPFTKSLWRVDAKCVANFAGGNEMGEITPTIQQKFREAKS